MSKMPLLLWSPSGGWRPRSPAALFRVSSGEAGGAVLPGRGPLRANLASVSPQTAG